MAFNMPPYTSVTLGTGLPSQGLLATPLVVTAPSLFRSTNSLYSIPDPKVPEAVDLLEINVSCPNVKEGAIAFGQDPDALFRITDKIRRIAAQPVIMKLTPNVTSIAEMARAAEAGGADAISLINTITGMKIDIERRTFVLANKTGGMSGPAIKPVAVRMVWQAARAVKIPIIGMGGIASAEDAIEFILAGATMVAAGAMQFHNPCLSTEIIDGIEAYMVRHQIEHVTDLIGTVQ